MTGRTRPCRLSKAAAVTTGVAMLGAAAIAQLAPSNYHGFAPITSDRRGVPTWSHPDMPQDVFTFVRICYPGRGGGNAWLTDYPDSDLNLSLRLQELTSLRVNPEPVQMTFTDPRLKDYPFVYIVEPGYMELSMREIAAMRDYCLNGGFVMFDDHWGDAQYQNVAFHLKQAFPELSIVDLTTEHPIFHAVFDLPEAPQIPDPWNAAQGRGAIHGPPHYRAIHDVNGRMMVLICHNTDTGDAWEREGIDETYFQEYAVKKAYPLAVNIIFYAMTH